MNNLKFGVLACGLLGLIGCFLPMVSEGPVSFSFWKLPELLKAMGAPDSGRTQVLITMAGYAAAAVAGLIAVVKPPMQRWQGVLALVGFALVLIKLRAGLGTGGGFVDLLKHGAIGAKLMCIAPILGVVVSILSLAKPETAR
jgi:hypothetical protein